ncbi:Uncharacterised protein [Legionella pneumophila]|nr:Uncharacterised protein [Legionella pneumophila]
MLEWKTYNQMKRVTDKTLWLSLPYVVHEEQGPWLLA